MRVLQLCLLAVLLWATQGQAWAKEVYQVAVLPMQSDAKSLGIYERPSAMVLAKAIGLNPAIKSQMVMATGKVPANVDLVLEARIVGMGDEQVMLEARLRRAATGQVLQTRATRVDTLTNIDGLVQSLARVMLEDIERFRLRATPYVLPTVLVPTSQEPGQRASDPQVKKESLAQVLVVPAVGQAAEGVVSVREPATAAMVDALGLMGVKAAMSRVSKTLPTTSQILREAALANIPYVLLAKVIDVKYQYREILWAKGTVQIVLLNSQGQRLIDRTIKSDTVVGARGDRHQALVFRVVQQGLDVARRDLQAVLLYGAPAVVKR